MIVLLLIVPILLLICLWFNKYYSYHKHLKTIPIPDFLPLIGNALIFRDISENLTTFMNLLKRYKTKNLRFTIGFRSILMITDYKWMEWTLCNTKLIDKSLGYRFLNPWLGTGLLTSGGEKWRKRRKMLTPSFHFQILEQFIDIFNSTGDELIEKFKKEVGKGSIDVYPFITLYALDVICETAMGTKVNAQKEENSIYVRCVKAMCQILTRRSFNPLFNYDFIYKFSNLYKEQCEAIKVLHDYTTTVIKKRREELRNEIKIENNGDEICVKKRAAFLDLLLQATIDGQPLSDEDIREEVDTFMFEGHDTTASAMSFALFSLANNPDVQNKAVDELNDIFRDDPKRAATHTDLANMKYLDLVIKETLRMYPSVPMIVRECKEDYNFNGTILKKGLNISMFLYGLHRDPDYFPNPEVFDPQRFNGDIKSPFTYTPFSAGPRNCIGQKFAILEIKSLLSKVLRNFELKPVVPAHTLKLVPETTLKSSNGILLRLEERKQS